MPPTLDLSSIGPLQPFRGEIWRGHSRRYDGLDDRGSHRSTGRFHRGPNLFPVEQTWPALYTSLELAVSLGEIMRARPTTHPKEFRFSEIRAELEAVADCRDLERLALDPDLLLRDWDYSLGHALSLAVRTAGAEAMLVPSASLLGDNLVIFPDRLNRDSVLSVVSWVDPNLQKAGGWV